MFMLYQLEILNYMDVILIDQLVWIHVIVYYMNVEIDEYMDLLSYLIIDTYLSP